MPTAQADLESRSAERLKFFTDAVVAIAMTLLILPLLESVPEAAAEGLGTADWVHDHGNQLFAFALSFVVIARFWLVHERVYSVVEYWSGALMVGNFLWMLCVVFLAVATAIVGQLEFDRAEALIYIGTMLGLSLSMLFMYTVLRRQPELVLEGQSVSDHGYAAVIAMTVLVALALVLAAGFPQLNMYPMFLLALTSLLAAPIQRVLFRSAV